MREDIVGMLKNAIEHGGNPARVAQSLINSGYPVQEVQQALAYITSTMPQSSTQGNPNSQITPQTINQNQPHTQGMPSVPTPQTQPYMQTLSPSPPQYILKPLPSTKYNPGGTGKLIFMIIILLILISSLISVIIFKDKILNWIS